MKNYLLEFVKELEKGDEGKPYDFICNNAYSMNKGDLKAIIQECVYVIGESSKQGFPASLSDLAESIREWHEDELLESED